MAKGIYHDQVLLLTTLSTCYLTASHIVRMAYAEQMAAPHFLASCLTGA